MPPQLSQANFFFFKFSIQWRFQSTYLLKVNCVAVCSAKTQISLGIRPVWSESSLSAWRKLGSLATFWVHSEDSDQPGHPPRLIRVFAVRMKKAWILTYPMNAQRRLIRLGRCRGWSESSLGAQSSCWFCCEAAHIGFEKNRHFQ